MARPRQWSPLVGASWLAAALACCCCLLQAPPSEAKPLTLDALLSPLDTFPLPPPSKTFRCENAGFARVDLPCSFVLDGVCDCCDGSDERVSGDNPWRPKKKEEPTGGWLGGLLGGDAPPQDDSPGAVDSGPCPNSCASQAATFLADLTTKVASYARAVDRRVEMMQGLPAVNQKLAEDGKQAHAALQALVQVYRDQKAELDANSQSVELQEQLQRTINQANGYQWTMEQNQWLLGQAVPHPRNRQVQRPAGQFGASREWLLLWDRCFEYAWPQRRFGSFGENTDWYLMTLCPMQNATQVALATPPPREGARWREPLAEGEVVAVPLGQAVAAAEKLKAAQAKAQAAATAPVDAEGAVGVEQTPPAEPPPVYVLGYWTGELMSTAAADETKKVKEEAQATGGATAADVGTPGAPAATAPKKQKKKPVRSPPPGSFLNRLSDSSPTFGVALRQGQECWQVGPRSVNVQIACGETTEIVRVQEDGKCKYGMTLQSPLACDKDHLAKLQQQLADHTKWFARPMPPLGKAKTAAQLLEHDEL